MTVIKISFFLILIFTYLAAPDLVACGILTSPTRDWTQAPALGAWRLSHWVTRTTSSFIFKMFSRPGYYVLDSFLYLLIYALIQPRDFKGLTGDKMIIKIWFLVSGADSAERRRLHRIETTSTVLELILRSLYLPVRGRAMESTKAFFLKVTRLATWGIKANMQSFWLLSHWIFANSATLFSLEQWFSKVWSKDQPNQHHLRTC